MASIGRLGNEKTWDNIAIEYSNRFSFLKFGEQSVEKVSQYLRFVDFGIAASPYGLIGKSSAVASMTEHGLPVVVNRDDGHLKGFDLSNSSVDPWLHKLDNTFQNKTNITNQNSSYNRANNDSPLPRSPSKTIGSVIRGYKIGVTKWVRANTNIETLWQRNYYEIIIRNEQSYETISKYIINNPAKWQVDKFFSQQNN